MSLADICFRFSCRCKSRNAYLYIRNFKQDLTARFECSPRSDHIVNQQQMFSLKCFRIFYLKNTADILPPFETPFSGLRFGMNISD